MSDAPIGQLLAMVGIEPADDELRVLEESFTRMRSILDRMYESDLAGDVSPAAWWSEPIKSGPIDWLDSPGPMENQQRWLFPR